MSFRLISEAMRAFAEASADPTALPDAIARFTGTALGQYCGVAVVSDDGAWLDLQATYALEPQAKAVLDRFAPEVRMALDAQHPLARAIASGKALHASPIPAEMIRTRFPSAEAQQAIVALELRSVLFVPLRANAVSVGALTLVRHGRAATPFSDDELEVAQALADHAGLAIANARELARRERVEARLKLLTTLAREFTAATRDYRHLLDLVTTRIGETLGGMCAARFLTDDGLWLETSGAVYHADPALAEEVRASIRAHPVRVGEGLAGRAVATGEPIYLPSIDPEALAATVAPEQREMTLRLGIDSVMCVPLRAQGVVIGVISLSRRVSEPHFAPEDLALFVEVATHAALAITNGRLLEASRRELATEAVLRRNFLEAAPDAVVIVDASGEIVLVNSQTEALFGYARAELLGRSIDMLVPPRARDAHLANRASYAALPSTRPMGAAVELFAVRKDGSEFAAEISRSPIQTPDGTLVAAAVRDVTERRRDAEERSRRMEEANRLKSEFLANMSHELRTPLNAIIGFTALMHAGKAGPIAELHREYLGDILASSRHLLQLINDILDLAKVEAGKMELRLERVEVARVIHEVRDIVRGIAADRGIQLSVAHDAEALPTIHVDPRILKQVLYNYLSNAIKFTPEGGHVWLRIEPAGADQFRVEVEDDGAGIAPEDLPRLFVEFQQLDQGMAKRHAGTGLGLALTRRMAEALGGTVGVTSTSGRGSVFWALMPRGAA